MSLLAGFARSRRWKIFFGKRQAAGDAGYADGFIEHYLLPTLYPHALTREIQVAMGAVVLVLNLIIYAAVWRRRRRAE